MFVVLLCPVSDVVGVVPRLVGARTLSTDGEQYWNTP